MVNEWELLEKLWGIKSSDGREIPVSCTKSTMKRGSLKQNFEISMKEPDRADMGSEKGRGGRTQQRSGSKVDLHPEGQS